MIRKINSLLCCLFTMSSLCYPLLAHSQESISGQDGAYRAICWKAANDPYYYKNFRSMIEYTHIVEFTEADEFADYIRTKAGQEVRQNIDNFRKLDSVGNPFVKEYAQLGVFSAATLRYITIADHLRKLFELPVNANIVEIGAGFGGQSYILSFLN